jgi:hypothetical protein
MVGGAIPAGRQLDPATVVRAAALRVSKNRRRVIGIRLFRLDAKDYSNIEGSQEIRFGEKASPSAEAPGYEWFNILIALGSLDLLLFWRCCGG